MRSREPLVFEGLDKRWHGISGGWADIPERIRCDPANTFVVIFESSGKRWHGGGADLPERAS
jgi:hypothetical protein